MAEDYTYTTVMDWRKRAHELAGNVLDLESAAKKQREHVAELAHQLAQADSNMVALAARNAELAARLQELERENAELRKAYEPVEKSFRVVWTACAFGYEGTPVGEAFNHIKAWFDGVQL